MRLKRMTGVATTLLVVAFIGHSITVRAADDGLLNVVASNSLSQSKTTVNYAKGVAGDVDAHEALEYIEDAEQLELPNADTNKTVYTQFYELCPDWDRTQVKEWIEQFLILADGNLKAELEQFLEDEIARVNDGLEANPDIVYELSWQVNWTIQVKTTVMAADNDVLDKLTEEVDKLDPNAMRVYNDAIEYYRQKMGYDDAVSADDSMIHYSRRDIIESFIFNKWEYIGQIYMEAERLIFFEFDAPAPPDLPPVDPTEPDTTDPTDPTEPDTTDTTEPEEPEQPVDPTEPEQPTEPTEPEQPTNPTEPETKPKEPEQPTNPTEPEQPTNSTEPLEPETEPEQPTNPTEPEEPETKPKEPAKHNKQEQPERPTEPERSTKIDLPPIRPTEPDLQPVKPTEPERPTESEPDLPSNRPTEPEPGLPTKLPATGDKGYLNIFILGISSCFLSVLELYRRYNR